MKVDVKICGLCRPEDARVAGAAGADYLGVVFAPSPRRRTPEEARAIWSGTGAPRVGVFVDAPEESLRSVIADAGLEIAQLHGDEDPAVCRRVRDSGVAVWKAVRVSHGDGLWAEVERYAEVVDGLLLEGASRRGRGGVGARFDWSEVGAVRSRWPDGVRLILAGGLSPSNVARAIEAVRPDVVDVSSGVERRPGVKDPAALREFIEAVRGSALRT